MTKKRDGCHKRRAPGAACVFNAPPTDREFEIPTEEWNLLMRMRLHVFLDPLFLPKPSMFQLIELGEGQLDEFECRLCNHRGAGVNYVHLLTCPGGGGTIRRHDDVANTWAALLTTSGIIYNYQEPRPVPGTTHRTDHEFHFDNQDKAYDLAVTTSQAKTNLPYSARKQLYAAQKRFEFKMGHHGAAHMDNTIQFLPLIMEMTGAFHPEMLKEIEALVSMKEAHHHPVHSCWTISDSYQYWTHLISMKVVRDSMNTLLRMRRRTKGILEVEEMRALDGEEQAHKRRREE